MVALGFNPSKKDDSDWTINIAQPRGAATRAQGQEDERKKLALDFNATGTGNPAGYVNASAWLQCPNS